MACTQKCLRLQRIAAELQKSAADTVQPTVSSLEKLSRRDIYGRQHSAAIPSNARPTSFCISISKRAFLSLQLAALIQPRTASPYPHHPRSYTGPPPYSTPFRHNPRRCFSTSWLGYLYPTAACIHRICLDQLEGRLHQFGKGKSLHRCRSLCTTHPPPQVLFSPPFPLHPVTFLPSLPSHASLLACLFRLLLVAIPSFF